MSILFIIALVCWFLAAIPLPRTSPVHLGWLGMFFYGLSMFIKWTVKCFFNDPYKCSFKDLVAAVSFGSFLIFCWKALNSSQVLGLVKVLTSLIGIILGGYFVQEGAAMYFQRSQDTSTTQKTLWNRKNVVNVSPVSDPVQAEEVTFSFRYPLFYWVSCLNSDTTLLKINPI